MDKKEILDILDNAKDDRGDVPMRLVRQALDKLSAIQPISSVQPEPDCVSRRAAIDALAKQMPKSYTLDGSHPADEEIYKIQEIYVDCIESIEILPAVQPDRAIIDDCLHHIYKNISVHTATGGVIAIRYYMEKLYEEIYGEGEKPWWMT